MNIISIRGANEHNLKDIDIDIPKNKLVVFTGVSGSGKSSLVFDTIYAEAFRRFADASHVPLYILGNSSWFKIKRPKVKSITGLPPALGLPQKQSVASKISTVGSICSVSDLFRVYFAAFGNVFCRHCNIPLSVINTIKICELILQEFNEKKLMFISTIAEKRKGTFLTEIEQFKQLGFSKLIINGEMKDLQDESIEIDGKKLNTIDLVVDFFTLSPEKKPRIERAVLQSLEYGKGVIKIQAGKEELKYNTKSTCPQCGESAPKLDPRYFSHSSIGQCPVCKGSGSTSENLPADLFPCPACEGSRLNKTMPIVRVCGKTFAEIHQMSFSNLALFLQDLLFKDANFIKSKMKIYTELLRLSNSINKLCLGHLVLNRSGYSLSPGELQRLRLSSMISNQLRGVLYIIDEACQGLIDKEVLELVKVLKNIIFESKASVLCVEHHPSFLAECDYGVLMGPAAGVYGGKIVSTANSPLHSDFFDPPLKTQKKSIDLHVVQDEEMLSNLPKKNLKKKIAAISLNIPPSVNHHLIFENISIRSLQKKHLLIHQKTINVLYGASGSGKSSFIELILLPVLQSLEVKNAYKDLSLKIDFNTFCKLHINGNILVNSIHFIHPGAIIRSSRRTVASAINILQALRVLFSSLPISQINGLNESHFSWNSKLGRCEKCEGKGFIEIPQKYVPALRSECELCLGSKLNSRSLLARFKGYNFADIMQMSLKEASSLFSYQKNIVIHLTRACQFGLEYILLGQSMDSLSGGELQRLLLTIELKRTNLEGSWFILMHPSTGLHTPDIHILCELMQVMTKQGATFILAENRKEFLNFAGNSINFSL